MYRPHSQATRQRSNQLKDGKSKSKKPTNKQYKEYVKRLIQNNPNHIDYEKKLKLDTIDHNKYDLKEKLEKLDSRNKGDDKQWLRSGVIRFVKPKISQRDFKRFKKLFQLFIRIQKIKQEILSLNCANARYVRQNVSFYNQQKLRELKENLLKLQLEEEKILLEIQNQGKQNLVNRVFSHQQTLNRNLSIEKKLSNLNMLNYQGEHGENFPLTNLQSPSQDGKLLEALKAQNWSGKKEFSPENILTNLIQTINRIDPHSRKKHSADKIQQTTRNFIEQYEQIQDFLILKQKTIDELFTKLSKITQIAKSKDTQNNSQRLLQKRPYSGQKVVTRNNQGITESPISSQQTISEPQKNTHKSFKFLLQQIQDSLKRLLITEQNLKITKERNNQLAKQLLLVSKEQKGAQQQNNRIKSKLEKQVQYVKVLEKENDLLIRKYEKVEKQLNESRKNFLESQKRFEREKIQSEKYVSYYREYLAKQQEVVVLVEMNKKLKEGQLNMYETQKDKRKGMVISQTVNINIEPLNLTQSHLKQNKPLIYKQQEKKNKKLAMQNNNLTEQLQAIKKQVEAINDQRSEYKQKFQQEKNRNQEIKENLRKLEEQFECLVREKFQIEQRMGQFVQQCQARQQLYEGWQEKVMDRLEEVSENLAQTKQLKQQIHAAIHQISTLFDESFFKEQILSFFSQQMQQKCLNQANQNEIVEKQSIQREVIHLQNQLSECLAELNQLREKNSQILIEKQLMIRKKQQGQKNAPLMTKNKPISNQHANKLIQTQNSKNFKRITSNVVSEIFCFTEKPSTMKRLQINPSQLTINIFPQKVPTICSFTQVDPINLSKTNTVHQTINLIKTNQIQDQTQGTTSEQKSIQTLSIQVLSTNLEKKLNFCSIFSLYIQPIPYSQKSCQITLQQWLQNVDDLSLGRQKLQIYQIQNVMNQMQKLRNEVNHYQQLYQNIKNNEKEPNNNMENFDLQYVKSPAKDIPYGEIGILGSLYGTQSLKNKLFHEQNAQITSSSLYQNQSQIVKNNEQIDSLQKNINQQQCFSISLPTITRRKVPERCESQLQQDQSFDLKIV